MHHRNQTGGDGTPGEQGSREIECGLDREATGQHGGISRVRKMYCADDSFDFQELHDSEFGKREKVHKLKESRAGIGFG